MTTQESTTKPLTREDLSDKEQKLLDFCLAFQDDPDFNRLPIPAKILEVAGIKREYKYLNVMEATNYAFRATSINAHQYKGDIQVIDQSVSVSHFPNLTELADSKDTSETKNQQSEDSSSPPLLDDGKCIVPCVEGLGE
jgi:hypothetical protein